MTRPAVRKQAIDTLRFVWKRSHTIPQITDPSSDVSRYDARNILIIVFVIPFVNRYDIRKPMNDAWKHQYDISSREKPIQSFLFIVFHLSVVAGLRGKGTACSIEKNSPAADSIATLGC